MNIRDKSEDSPTEKHKKNLKHAGISDESKLRADLFSCQESRKTIRSGVIMMQTSEASINIYPLLQTGTPTKKKIQKEQELKPAD